MLRCPTANHFRKSSLERSLLTGILPPSSRKLATLSYSFIPTSFARPFLHRHDECVLVYPARDITCRAPLPQPSIHRASPMSACLPISLAFWLYLPIDPPRDGRSPWVATVPKAGEPPARPATLATATEDTKHLVQCRPVRVALVYMVHCRG